MGAMSGVLLAVLAGLAITLERPVATPQTVSAAIILEAPAEQVWERLSDVESWDLLFDDIEKLEVLAHEGDEWRLRLHTRSIGRSGPREYRLTLDRDARTAGLVLEESGLQSSMTFAVEPAEDGSRVTHAMTTSVSGMAGWLVPKAALDRLQDDCVRGYLVDLASAFEQDEGVEGD